MTKQIESLFVQVTDPIFYKESFRVVLESYLPYLRTHSTTQTVEVPLDVLQRYKGDLFGLFAALGNIPPEWDYLMMRLNGYVNPQMPEMASPQLLVPAVSVVNEIKALYNSANRV